MSIPKLASELTKNEQLGEKDTEPNTGKFGGSTFITYVFFKESKLIRSDEISVTCYQGLQLSPQSR